MLPETVSSGIGVVFLGLSNDDNIPLRSSGGQSQEKGNENHLQDVKHTIQLINHFLIPLMTLSLDVHRKICDAKQI